MTTFPGMKIAFVTPFLFQFARGIERTNWSLANALAHLGVQVDILAWDHPKPVDWGVISPGVHIHKVPYTRYFMRRVAIPYYFRWLSSGKYDWVVINFAGFGESEAFRLLRLQHPQKFCTVFHYPRDLVPHRYVEFEKSGLADRASHLIAVSNYVARGVKEQFNKACIVIGNGTDPAEFCPSPDLRATTRQKLGVPEDAFMIVSLAALEERKGIHRMIRAMPYILKEFKNAQYWVFGEGKFRATLEAEIARLGLADHVHLYGNSYNVVPYLAAADIGCLLAVGEAFSVAVHEYMAMQLPVLASDCPPFDELVQPAWGVTVDQESPEAIGDAVRTLLRNPAQRAAMGMAGRQEVIDHYTWERIAHDYLDLFTKIPVT